MGLHPQSCRQNLVAELSLPEFLILYHVCVAMPDWEVDVEILYLFGDLPLETAFLLLYSHHVFVSGPVAFNIFKTLLEEKRQILSPGITHSQTLYKDVTIWSGKLLEKDNLHANFIKSLQKTFFVVANLSKDILVETDHGLLVINWCQNEMMVISEGFVLG